MVDMLARLYYNKANKQENEMKREIIQVKVPRIKRRCVELYGRDTPFRPKVVESKRNRYVRQPKHRNSFSTD
jgi:hypothetical protein